MQRRVVRAATTVGEVLATLGVPTAALAEGRVFVGPRRATAATDAAPAGSEVVVHDPAPTVELPSPFVLHEGGGLLVVDKPAGIPTIPDLAGSAHSLQHQAARAIGLDPARLHPTSRLDRDVSGVVTFALDRAASAALAAARQEGRYDRLYVALAQAIEGASWPPGACLRWTWALVPDRAPRAFRALRDGELRKDAVPATSRARVAAVQGRIHALCLAPETGRTHQLRVHASTAGLPLLGDKLYGGPNRIVSATGAVRSPGRVALHCARVDIALPSGHVSATSPLPAALLALATFLGVELEEALRCPRP